MSIHENDRHEAAELANTDLCSLDCLVRTWSWDGDTGGTVILEWMPALSGPGGERVWTRA